jgi:NAD-dependent dihydropyrimidine dehydrogenase PreA subunit
MQESYSEKRDTEQRVAIMHNGESARASREKAYVEIESNLCKECNLCIEACPVNVLRVSDKLNVMGYHPVEYTGIGCTGCGICFYVCPEPGTFRIYKRAKKN